VYTQMGAFQSRNERVEVERNFEAVGYKTAIPHSPQSNQYIG